MGSLQRILGFNGASGKPLHLCPNCGAYVIAATWTERSATDASATFGPARLANVNSKLPPFSQTQTAHQIDGSVQHRVTVATIRVALKFFCGSKNAPRT